MAAVLGVSIRKYQSLAFTVSGAIAGLYGGLESLHSYSLTPGQYGFNLVVTVLAYVVLGGRRTVIGPLVGVAFLSLLPELSRPMAEYRPLVTGLIMIAVMSYLPMGLADTAIFMIRRRNAAREFLLEGKRHVSTAS